MKETEDLKNNSNEDLNEKFLSSWLRMSSTISNYRITTLMPFNEAFVCNVLMNQKLKDFQRKLTPTELCEKTHMHKTLMNRTLNSLEKKGLISRSKDEEDGRHIQITLEDNRELYSEQHKISLKVVDIIMNILGQDKVKEAIDIFEEMSDAVDKLFKGEEVEYND